MDVTLELAYREIECWLCTRPIVRGEVRLVETSEYRAGVEREQRTKRTYGHLECYVDLKQDHAHAALTQRDIAPSTLKAALKLVRAKNPKLYDEVAAFRAKHYRVIELGEASSFDDPTTQELLRELEADPESREVLAVLSDHLQQLGDPRGELIAMDLAGSVDLERADRRRALFKALKPPINNSAAFEWGFGFVRSLTLYVHRGLEPYAPILGHPSCRMLTTLVLYETAEPEPTAFAMELLPRSLRTLSIDGPVLSTDLSPLHHLRALAISDRARVRHVTVELLRLNLREELPLEVLPADFPAVKTLVIGASTNPQRLCDAGWFAHVQELHIDTHMVDAELVKAIETGARRLSRIVLLRGTIDEPLMLRLREMCASLDEGKAFVRKASGAKSGEHVRHAKKPEWGVGTVVRRFDGKVEIAFGTTTKTFPADSPFLQFD